MKNAILIALISGILYCSCEKGNVITIDDGQQFCPINWTYTGFALKDFPWAFIANISATIDTGSLRFYGEVNESGEGGLLSIDPPISKAYLSVFEHRASYPKEFSIQTAFKIFEFDENMRMALTASHIQPYSQAPLFGREDSLCEISLFRAVDGFRIEGRANERTILLGEKLPSFEKATLRLTRKADRWVFYCRLDFDAQMTVFQEMENELVETVSGPMAAGIRINRLSPNHGGETGKVDILLDKISIEKMGEQAEIDDFECNSVLF